MMQVRNTPQFGGTITLQPPSSCVVNRATLARDRIKIQNDNVVPLRMLDVHEHLRNDQVSENIR
jgi:hypothetical protein